MQAIQSEGQALALRHLPTVAVDLGFSGISASCGVAVSRDDESKVDRVQRFRSCIDTVAGYVHTHREIVLILEAPLSATFDDRGNPCARGGFESSPPKPRWWSLGAGATMALAAQYFLDDVNRAAIDVHVHVAEGFVVGLDSGHHYEVALSLLESFAGKREAQWHQPRPGARSVLDWLGPHRGQPCPAILAPGFA